MGPTTTPTANGPGILGAMWRYRLTVALTLALALAAGLGYALLQPAEYTAAARVQMVDPRQEGVFRSDPAGDDTRRQQNRVERFLSEEVLVRAAQLADSPLRLKELRDAVEAVPSAAADRITVNATTDDPATARDLANAVVEAYSAVFREQALADAQRTVDLLDDELAQLEEGLDESEAELARYTVGDATGTDDGPAAPAEEPPSPGYLTVLRAERDAQAAMLRSVLVTRHELLLDARAAQDVAAVEPATAPGAPSTSLVTTAAFAGVLGLVLGGMLAVWRTEREFAGVHADTSHGDEPAQDAPRNGAVVATPVQSRRVPHGASPRGR